MSSSHRRNTRWLEWLITDVHLRKVMLYVGCYQCLYNYIIQICLPGQSSHGKLTSAISGLRISENNSAEKEDNTYGYLVSSIYKYIYYICFCAPGQKTLNLFSGMLILKYS